MYDLILASASPRRKTLLEEEGYSFAVHTVKVSENIKENLNSRAAVTDIARRKALAFVDQYKHLELKGKLTLTADTMVYLGDRLLGKPKDANQAREFLRDLSKSTHSVITAMSLVFDGEPESITTKVVETEVEFLPLSEEDIEAYVATGEPMDKAGAYGIQGHARKFIKEFRGSYKNVVGLPVEEFVQWLEELGCDVHKAKP